MSRKNVETVSRLYEAFQRGGLETAVRLMAPKIEVVPDESIPDRQVFQGREGFLEWAERWFAPWADYRIEPLEFIESGDKVLVVQQDRGIDGPGGMNLDQTVWSVWTFEEGRVARLEFFLKEQSALEAAGVAE
jgi:ketosteroid isomerase-like protein